MSGKCRSLEVNVVKRSSKGVATSLSKKSNLLSGSRGERDQHHLSSSGSMTCVRTKW
jgi:hypothetical protein